MVQPLVVTHMVQPCVICVTPDSVCTLFTVILGFFLGGGVRPPSYHVQGLWVAGTEPSCHWGTFWIERLIYLTCTSLNCGRSWDTQREPTATANSAQKVSYQTQEPLAVQVLWKSIQ